LRVESVDLPEDDFTFAGGFGDDKVVVEINAVDIVRVDCCCGEMREGISCWEICCWRDCVEGSWNAGTLLVEDG
jgi:hypothetical protein